MWIKLAVFVAASAFIIYVSWSSLRAPGSHGFYRFFAWELIVALALLVVDGWFSDPLAWNQIISWALLIVCIPPLIIGVRGLTGGGKPTEQREGDDSLLAFEKTTALVTTGIYHYIRHPLYSSLLLLDWGIFFKAPGWLTGLIALAATGCLLATARADEAECITFFGPQYQGYMKGTKRFIPFVF